MPRVTIKRKEYMITDFRRWLIGEMTIQGIKQREIAEWLKITQPAVSVKIKNSEFTLKELLTIFEKLHADPETIAKLLYVKEN